MHLIVLTFFNDGEQLVELTVATEDLDRLRLPISKPILNELLVFFSGQRLHEEEIARGHRIFETRRANDNREVLADILNVERRIDLLR